MFKQSIDKSFTCFNVANIHKEEFEKSYSEFKALLKSDKKAEVEITSATQTDFKMKSEKYEDVILRNLLKHHHQ